MSDSNSEIGAIFDILKKNLEIKDAKKIIMYSISEKLLCSLFFNFIKNRVGSQDFQLLTILSFFKEQAENMDNEAGETDDRAFYNEMVLNFKELKEKLKDINCLAFYHKLIDFTLNFPKNFNSNYNEFTPENYLKIEVLIKEHFENNFFNQKHSKNKLDENYFNDAFVKTHSETYNYDYNVCCISTMFKLLKLLEIQNISNNDPDQFKGDGIISEKMANFISKNNNNKNTSSIANNIVEYFINSHLLNITKELYDTKTQINNYEIENNICLSLFIIKKIIKDYSFYFNKMELENLFMQLKKFKEYLDPKFSWPLPIGAFGMEIFEIIINEIYFQGITVLNELRNLYFIDTIDPKIQKLNVHQFNSAIFIYSEGEKQEPSKTLKEIFNNKNNYNKEIDVSVLSNNCKEDYIEIREFLVKIFLTLVRNSNFNINKDMLRCLIIKFLSKNNSNDNDDQKPEETKTDMEDGQGEKKLEDKDNTYNCLTKILKIIDVGLDKNYDSFAEDIKNIAQPLLQFTETYSNNLIKLKNLPITEYRYYKHPKLTSKKIGPLDSDFEYVHYNDKSKFNLFEFYFKEFYEFYQNNFKYLNNDDQEDKKMDNRKLRYKIYKDFKSKIILSEEKKMINVFIDQLYHAHTTIDNFANDKLNNIQDYSNLDFDFKKFWGMFTDNFEEIDINFLLYLVPWLDDVKHRNSNQNLSADEIPNILCEFLAGKDYIFNMLIYNPWVTFRSMESDIENWIESWNGTEKNKTFAKSTSLSPFYSFLKNPLKLYLTDASSLFKLHLYKITLHEKEGNGNTKKKLFWRNCEICFDLKQNNQMDKVKKDVSYGSLRIREVDMLGLEYSNEPVEVPLQDIVNIKLFNIFLKRDVPFYYNMTSNNDWLEVILQENCLDKSLKKIKKIIYNNIEDFVMSQIEMDSIHKYFKGSYIDITTDMPFMVKIDDMEMNKDNHNLYNRIEIEKYIRNGKHVSLPVVTFMPIIN